MSEQDAGVCVCVCVCQVRLCGLLMMRGKEAREGACLGCWDCAVLVAADRQPHLVILGVDAVLSSRHAAPCLRCRVLFWPYQINQLALHQYCQSDLRPLV